MSPSTGAASSSAGKGSSDKKEPKTVSDLLLQGPTTGAFEDWLPAVREKADQDCENWVKKAQITAWQVLATRQMPSCKNPETGKNEKPRLNDDVSREICAFMGPIPDKADSVPTFEALERIANHTRDCDRLRFVDYLLDLMRNEAAKGSRYFYITRDIVAAGPKTTNGKAVDLVTVLYHLKAEHGFSTVHDAQGNYVATYSGRWNVADTHFPLRVSLCYDDESRDSDWKASSGRMAALARAGRSDRKPKGLAMPSATIPPHMAALVNTLKQGVERAVQYISELCLAAFTSGEVEYVLTEEVWNQAPKLPNGKLPPFWPDDMEALSDHFDLERVVGSVFIALNRDDIGLEAAYDRLWPVTIFPASEE